MKILKSGGEKDITQGKKDKQIDCRLPRCNHRENNETNTEKNNYQPKKNSMTS